MRWLSLKLLPFVALLVLAGVVSHVQADTITRSFNSESSIEPGRVVALVAPDKTSVELAKADDPTRIYGVVVEQTAAPVTIQQQGQEIFVANSGFYPVLVSTENGSIVAGDLLSISSVAGIAAKVKDSQTFVLGRATQNFDGKTSSIGNNTNGSAIGKISAQISPGKNPVVHVDTAVPAPLRRLTESIAGKPLSASRIYSAMIILIMTNLIVFDLLWVGVRNGMIAIGRNPLSKHLVLQNMGQVIGASAIVLIGGLFGIYLLLRI